jgi:hypothetical protein
MYSGRLRRRCARSASVSTPPTTYATSRLVARRVLARHHHAVGDARIPPQRRLDLAQLDAEAAHLHLRVQPAQVLQRAVGPPPRPVARPVQPRARLAAEGIGDEALGRQPGAAQVAARQPAAAEVQLARHPGRKRQQRGTEHVGARVGDRPPDRRRPARAAQRPGAVRGVFGGTVEVVHALDPAAGVERVHQLGPQRLARQVHRPHPGRDPVALQQRRDRRRHRVDQPHLVRRGRPRQRQRVLHHDHAAAERQREEELEDGEVEGDRRRRQHAGQLLRREHGRRPRQERNRALVLDRHALRDARAPGGVDQVRQAPRHASARRAVGALRSDLGRRAVHAHHRHAVRNGKRRAQRLLRQQRHHAGVGEGEREPLGGIGRIERDVRAPRLQHGEEGDDHLQPALQAHAHPRLAPHAQADEVVRQPVRPLVQLGVRQLRFLDDHGHRSGRARRLRLEELVDAPVGRILGLRPVPLLQHERALRLAEQVQPREPHVRLRGDLLQHPLQVPHHALDGVRLEQVGAVVQFATQALGSRREAQREIELGALKIRSDSAHVQPRQSAFPAPGVLQCEHHLEEGRVAQAALGLQLGHQLLEGHLLVLVRAQRHLAHPPQHLPKARVSTEIRPQHQGVDEEADQLLHLPARASGDGAAHDDVLDPAVLREQHLEGAQQRHVQRRPLAPPERLRALQQLGGEIHRNRLAPVRPHRRAGMVRRQLQQLRRSRELLRPVRELPIQDLALQLLALPHGVVRVLHRQLGERRLPSRQVRLVQRRQLAEEHPHAPPVADDVVHGKQQHVVFFAQPQQRRAEERSRGEVERPPTPPRRCGA